MKDRLRELHSYYATRDTRLRALRTVRKRNCRRVTDTILTHAYVIDLAS